MKHEEVLFEIMLALVFALTVLFWGSVVFAQQPAANWLCPDPWNQRPVFEWWSAIPPAGQNKITVAWTWWSYLEGLQRPGIFTGEPKPQASIYELWTGTVENMMANAPRGFVTLIEDYRAVCGCCQ